jgi:hypothetical protein
MEMPKNNKRKHIKKKEREREGENEKNHYFLFTSAFEGRFRYVVLPLCDALHIKYIDDICMFVCVCVHKEVHKEKAGDAERKNWKNKWHSEA